MSSRTPEGLPSRCPLCGAASGLNYSTPSGDAPCPNCGHLIWRSTQLLQQIQKTLCESLSVSPNDVTVDASFAELGFDSLDLVEFIMSQEDELGMTIPDEDYAHLRTIGDAARYFESRQRQQKDGDTT